LIVCCLGTLLEEKYLKYIYSFEQVNYKFHKLFGNTKHIRAHWLNETFQIAMLLRKCLAHLLRTCCKLKTQMQENYWATGLGSSRESLFQMWIRNQPPSSISVSLKIWMRVGLGWWSPVLSLLNRVKRGQELLNAKGRFTLQWRSAPIGQEF
jgi:hypothetical protein